MDRTYRLFLMTLTIILFGIGWTIEKDIYAQSDEIRLTILLGTHPSKIIIKAHTAEKDLKYLWFEDVENMLGKLEKSDSPEVSYVLPSKGEIERSKERKVTISLMVINAKGEKQGANITFDVLKRFIEKDCQNARKDLKKIKKRLSAPSSGDLKREYLDKIKIQVNRLREKECPDSNTEELLKKLEGMQACQGDAAQLNRIKENLKNLGNTDGLGNLREIETHQESLMQTEGELDALSNRECVKNLVEDELRKLNELKSCLNDMAESEKIKDALGTLKESESSGDLKFAEARLRDLNALGARLKAARDKRCLTDLNETENRLNKLKIRLIYEKKREEIEGRLEKLKNKFRKMRGDAEKLNKLKEFRHAEERLKELKSITEQLNAVNDSDGLKNIEKELDKFDPDKPSATSSATTVTSTTAVTSSTTTSSATTTSLLAATTTVDYIQQQLRKADGLFKGKKYTTPPRNNAFDIYKNILRSEPANPHARKKIRKIMQEYKKWGDNAYNQRRYGRSGTHYRKYLRIAEYVMNEFGDKSIGEEIRRVRRRLEKQMATSTISTISTTRLPTTSTTIYPASSSTTMPDSDKERKLANVRQLLSINLQRYKKIKAEAGSNDQLIQVIENIVRELREIEAIYSTSPQHSEMRRGIDITGVRDTRRGMERELFAMEQ